jgi:hypothetical protein
MKRFAALALLAAPSPSPLLARDEPAPVTPTPGGIDVSNAKVPIRRAKA